MCVCERVEPPLKPLANSSRLAFNKSVERFQHRVSDSLRSYFNRAAKYACSNISRGKIARELARDDDERKKKTVRRVEPLRQMWLYRERLQVWDAKVFWQWFWNFPIAYETLSQCIGKRQKQKWFDFKLLIPRVGNHNRLIPTFKRVIHKSYMKLADSFFSVRKRVKRKTEVVFVMKN